MERLHKYIARCGVASRRAAETLISEGRVELNGEVVTEMGVKVSENDEVHVDGVRLSPPKKVVVLFHKPKGVVTTLKDTHGRRTVAEYMPDIGVVLKPVGRLDMDSEGLILCTNDGDLAEQLTHPRHGVEKEYEAVVRGNPEEAALDRLRKGVFVEGRKTAPASIVRIGIKQDRDTTMLRIIIHEGRNRQIRRMCESVGHPVKSLKRVRYAFLKLTGVPKGTCRVLTKQEVDRLRGLAGDTERAPSPPRPSSEKRTSRSSTKGRAAGHKH